MKNNRIQRLVVAALLAAMICVATMVIKFPIQATGGYINLGDGAVILTGFVMGPVYGAAAAGIGSALADLFSGYAVYVPATFVIKAAVAAAAGLAVKKVAETGIVKILLSACASELLMVCGYFLFEWAILGLGVSAVQGLAGNAVQALGGVVTAAVLIPVIRRLDIRSLRADRSAQGKK